MKQFKSSKAPCLVLQLNLETYTGDKSLRLIKLDTCEAEGSLSSGLRACMEELLCGVGKPDFYQSKVASLLQETLHGQARLQVIAHIA